MMISTERCIVRPFEEPDIDEFMTYRNDLDWMRYQEFKGLDRQAYLDELLGNFSLRDGVQLAIVCNKTDVLIGDIYMKEENSAFWIGYTISPQKARQGYAYEVVSAVIAALRARGAVCVKTSAKSGNVASIALLEKLGFQYLGTNDDEQVFCLEIR